MADKNPKKESLEDLEQTPIDPAAAEKVKGGVAPPDSKPGYVAPPDSKIGTPIIRSTNLRG